MADATYDVVIIGGGHNGLICACYLAWAGMKVAVFEKEYELGGGACSEEQPLPAFVSNPCASFTHVWNTPAWLDFKLWEKGGWYLFNQEGADSVSLFDDGTCLVKYSPLEPDLKTGELKFSEDKLQKTFREISLISERDAETYMRLWEIYPSWREAQKEQRLNPPPPWPEKDPLERLLGDPKKGMIDPAWQVMTVWQVACDLFESPELRLNYMRMLLSSTGCFADDVAPLSTYVSMVATCLDWVVPGTILGGTHSIAHAIQKALTELGGEFFVQHEVEKVLIENGKATGIRLTNGTEIKATKAVVSGINVTQTFLRLIGKENINPHLVRKIENFSYDRANIHWAWFALHELPDYKASQINPDCNKTRLCDLMPKDLDYYISRYQHELFVRGFPRKLYLFVGNDTLVDPSRSPAGKHNFLLEEFTAPARLFTEKEWLQMKKDFVEEVMKQWKIYAPNMTRDKFIDAWDNSPYDTVHRNLSLLEGSWSVGAMTKSQMGRYRPCPELSGDRTPIEKLYLCGATQHYGGGLRAVNGYICYKVMTQDLGLPQIWKEKGRPY